MTSGLPSVRHKQLPALEEVIAARPEPFDRLFKLDNTFPDQIRQVSKEDKESLADSGLGFDFYALVGGQLVADRQHLLYPVYPQGNWVEIGGDTPYQIIG